MPREAHKANFKVSRDIDFEISYSASDLRSICMSKITRTVGVAQTIDIAFSYKHCFASAAEGHFYPELLCCLLS